MICFQGAQFVFNGRKFMFFFTYGLVDLDKENIQSNQGTALERIKEEKHSQML